MLPERVDAAAAAALWAAHAGRAPAAIDFSRVREIDSAGLALVLAWREASNAGGAVAPTPPRSGRGVAQSGLPPLPQGGLEPILLEVPQRFVQLCRAHRIEGVV